ncbi:hypothetical protein SAMN02799624_06054 [Paenibacillus sp. UNC496MF]|uniref:hypothetical protein n=1 Tax=Paenibacillus sp. UNC496MF TaxID=1502753 RepID=UPI0008ED52B6|nr:hypothetical protein [Paenibacillus sp. UNC496MF]SFJ80674.1 hypothetical protein SAMN02799624_06054 [Paenibacillus sp. UNC496MF]
MNPFERSADSRPARQGKRDNPEGVPTEKESLLDKFASERTVDPIPVEDQTIEQRDEADKERMKRDSSSERKYRTGI